ncbi:CsgG/HfaB family protein [uncultured Victivallis sp.]|uniref:CsgG/HfaB family protein n=1 Tax=uncultured Victivallis sp. TaxID=354118 RepID=UPI0025FF3C86|nr:CsgG/HfaB family protein [uncultured Victivallis sp.]
MKKFLLILLTALSVSCVWAESVQIPTVAVLPFEARTRSGEQNADGKSIAELIGISLLETGSVELVERAELDKALDELQLSAVGLTEKESQLKLGKFVGARILITGSMFQSGDKHYLVAKIIGTETSRVMGCSVSGTGDFAGMTGELAPKIAAILEKQSEKLLPRPESVDSAATQLKSTVSGKQRKVFVRVKEEINVSVPDPAAETALKALLLELGFDVVNAEAGADFTVTGEAVASQAGDYRKFTSASARVELSVFDREKKLLATGAAKESLAGATYVIAAKEAIEQAALRLSGELFPVMK